MHWKVSQIRIEIIYFVQLVLLRQMDFLLSFPKDRGRLVVEYFGKEALSS